MAARVCSSLMALYFVVSTGLADVPLEDADIKQILLELTSNRQYSWIREGTIQARHEQYRAPRTTDINEVTSEISSAIHCYLNAAEKPEVTEELRKMRLDAIPFNTRYRLQNEYTMLSHVLVEYDGQRFYWRIDVLSREDSVVPDKKMRDNFKSRYFNLDWNRHRIFSWNGEDYTMYFLPGNHAVIRAGESSRPPVNGPLTAGLIPWGRGEYTYDNILNANPVAVARDTPTGKRVELSFDLSNGARTVIELDQSKDYIAVSQAITRSSGVVVITEYRNHILVSHQWVPQKILVSQADSLSGALLGYDLWEFTEIDTRAPSPTSFQVDYESGALVEYYSETADRPLMFRASSFVNPDLVLAEKLSALASSGIAHQNCGTLAASYVAEQMGKPVSKEQLSELINPDDDTTSLYAIKTYLESTGLYCRAIRTNMETLKDLVNDRSILHIPGKGHFVVVEGISGGYIWLTDLASSKFHYRKPLDFFDMDWTEGVALIVSTSTIHISGDFSDISVADQRMILGASGYQCTNLIQEEDVIYCSQPVQGICEGYYEFYYERWGCESAESGSCSTSAMIQRTECPCILDPNNLSCEISGDWTTYYMRACY